MKSTSIYVNLPKDSEGADFVRWKEALKTGQENRNLVKM